MSTLVRWIFTWPALALLASAASARGGESLTAIPRPLDLRWLSGAESPAGATDAAATGSAFAAAPIREAEFAGLPWLRPRDSETTDGQVDDGYYRTLYRRFTLSLGVAAYAKFHTSIQVSGDASIGAILDGEELLGLEESRGVARLDGTYAFNRRHWLQFSYYDIERDGERAITDDIQVGNVVIPAGTVETKFDTAIMKLAYRYNFVTDKRTVIGGSFGIHLMRIDTAIRSQTFSVEEEFKVDAPLPLFGLHGAYALAERWKLIASAEFLQFDLGDYRGVITDTRLAVEHDPFEYFGWGVGLNGFNVDARIQGNGGLRSELEYGYQGLMIYLRFML